MTESPAPTTRDRPLLQVPVTSLDDAQSLATGLVDEFYVGVLPEAWRDDYGDAESLTRRQGARTHFQDLGEVKDLLCLARRRQIATSLLLNAPYSSTQGELLRCLLGFWQSNGGDAVVVTEPGLVSLIRREFPGLRIHASLLTGVFNGHAARLFADLGVSRIVLPRALSVDDVYRLIRSGPSVEYSVVVLFQRCLFIDAFCRFHHAVHYPDGVPAEFAMIEDHRKSYPVVLTDDPNYEGHGCQYPWVEPADRFRVEERTDQSGPFCAACDAPDLVRAGVGVLKLAGRGYPVALLSTAVEFLAHALALPPSLSRRERETSCAALYLEAFGRRCDPSRCYY